MGRHPVSGFRRIRRDPSEAPARGIRGHHLAGRDGGVDPPGPQSSPVRGRVIAAGSLAAVVLAALGSNAAPALPVLCSAAYLALFYTLMVTERRIPTSQA